MGDLSEHFSRREFACKCGCGACAPSPSLMLALERIRTTLDAPVIVHSGTRCEAHNRAEGGARASQHLIGVGGYSLAADISSLGKTPREMYAAVLPIAEIARGGIGVYRWSSGLWWVHVDVRGTVARWAFLDGKAVDMNLALGDVSTEERMA
ncbi:MAG: D-Ala-D-Ala carboxypeptidase family metallohydrolase [Phycisphaerales bacterium]